MIRRSQTPPNAQLTSAKTSRDLPMNALRPLLIATLAGTLSAADVLTVTPAGAVTIVGTTPPAAAANQVQVGDGQIKAGGAVTAGNFLIPVAARATGTVATGDQLVRADDPRLSDSRLANGGNASNADTVDGKHAADFI